MKSYRLIRVFTWLGNDCLELRASGLPICGYVGAEAPEKAQLPLMLTEHYLLAKRKAAQPDPCRRPANVAGSAKADPNSLTDRLESVAAR